ncbi:MAG: DNA-3-methyladenine glycosylase 2 family protein [Nitrososphaerota archaeon]|nr:DNA-3-methyladenine glycosylase 2 family protein [Nitrososphaerota archaeon]MDG7023920.1 DNA-3-methyladenine glycosylase 2 family protein [Nitrososphaerota archaeon]
MNRIHFIAKPIPPFRLDLTAWALRRRPVNSIDRMVDGVYRRVLVVDGTAVAVSVAQGGSAERPKLEVVGIGRDLPSGAEGILRGAVSAILGLNVDLADFYSMSSKHRRLKALAARFRGVKPPRFPSIYETLVNAIACQQVSLNVGLILLSRLSLKYGLPPAQGDGWSRSFPTAEAVSRADLQALRGLGFSRQKAGYLLELSRSVCTGQLDLEGLDGMNDRDSVAFLTQIRGIGRWSAEYTLLRGLGRLGVFPGDDVGGQNSLRRWMGLQRSPNYKKVQDLLERWKRFRGLLYFHLLLKGLDESGYLEPVTNLHASASLAETARSRSPSQRS